MLPVPESMKEEYRQLRENPTEAQSKLKKDVLNMLGMEDIKPGEVRRISDEKMEDLFGD